MKALTIKWQDISPKKAEAYLEKNVTNRPLREDVVRALEADMVSGNWVPTHQGIAFNDRDELIDGQHRLSAIVRSGVTVRMLVTHGLPTIVGETQTMDVVDRGVGRSIGDQLKLQHGWSNPNLAVAIMATLGALAIGRRVRRQTTSQVLKALEIYGRHAAEIGKLIDKTKERRFRRAPFCSALTFARAVEPGMADRFLNAMVSGANLGAGSPELTLRNFLLSDVSASVRQGGSMIDRIDLCRLILNALHAFAEKRSWAKPVGGRNGYVFFAERQRSNLEKLAVIYLGEVGSLELDKVGKACDYSPPKPSAVITAKNFKLTPAAESLLHGIEMSDRAHRKAGTSR